MSRIVKRHPVYVDRVELPDGSASTIAEAVAAGYVVEGTPAAALALADAQREAAYSAVLELPEAVGRFHAARHLAATGTAPDLAARMLAGMPVDDVDPAPAVAEPAPLDPRAARLAEIAASARTFNRAKGYA